MSEHGVERREMYPSAMQNVLRNNSRVWKVLPHSTYTSRTNADANEDSIAREDATEPAQVSWKSAHG